MDIELILSPNYAMIGLSWFTRDEEYDYNEIDIYILFVKISFCW